MGTLFRHKQSCSRLNKIDKVNVKKSISFLNVYAVNTYQNNKS
jgi:hypothetical protein